MDTVENDDTVIATTEESNSDQVSVLVPYVAKLKTFLYHLVRTELNFISLLIEIICCVCCMTKEHDLFENLFLPWNFLLLACSSHTFLSNLAWIRRGNCGMERTSLSLLHCAQVNYLKRWIFQTYVWCWVNLCFLSAFLLCAQYELHVSYKFVSYIPKVFCQIGKILY